MANFMGLILATALVLQQLTAGFSMTLAAGLQQLTFMGVYVVPGEVLVGAQQFAGWAFTGNDMTFKPQRIEDNTGKYGDAGGDNRVQQGNFPAKGYPH